MLLCMYRAIHKIEGRFHAHTIDLSKLDNEE